MYKHDLQGIPNWLHSYFVGSRVCMKGGTAAQLAAPATTVEASEIARKQYEETQPLRDMFMQDWLQTMQGGQPQFMETMYSGLKQPIEQQYDVARENIISSLPQGGGLQSELANLETARAQGLQDVLQNIWQDQLSKAYGYAAGAPQLAISGLSGQGETEAALRMNKLNAMVSSSNQAAGTCCWNFLAAHGKITDDVKRYRNEHYPKGCPVSKGYKWMSEWFVPLMKLHPRLRKFIDLVIFTPMTRYAEWYYGKNWYGWIFKPIVIFATGLWGEWGKRIPQARRYYMWESLFKDKTGA